MRIGKILPAQERFATVLTFISLRPQKLALRARTICAAGASFHEEPFAQRRGNGSSQNLSDLPLSGPVKKVQMQGA
ncbi:MAG: hypothetical protein KBH73_02590, partial [Syntrophobacterales bacterium]|nr:hypothetical protein [Syntrophobacterales bacterium]